MGSVEIDAPQMADSHASVRPAHHVRPERVQFSAVAILAGVLGIAAGLRFAFLGQNSLWFDEAFVAWVVRFPWRAIPGILRATDAHPPLYYLLMKAWTAFAGTGEVALRIPSACFSLGSVLLTYALMRRTSTEVASLLGAFLVAVSPFAVMAGQEARMYPLLGLLAVGSTLALQTSVERGGILRWGTYAVLGTLMVYTHYFGFFVLIAHGIWVLGYERRHAVPWLAAMACSLALYAPWAPSLFYQIFDAHGWAWYRNPVTVRNLVDLLGLFAFGGSLFGATSYFFGGTLGPVGQLVIVLPFLAVLWCGIASFTSDRRALALLALPPAVTIGAAFLISLAKPMFYPRWFSFLLPFYAVFLARGIVDVAGRLRGWREPGLALLTAGLLLFGVPVLDRYYFDPHFRPYRWRAAADLVRKEAQPGDFLLYVNGAAELAFTYYFREPHPSLTLFPIEGAGGDRRLGFTAAEARQLAAHYPRVWLITTVPFRAPMVERLRPALDGAFRVVGVGDFTAAWVHLLVAAPSSSR